MYCRRCRYLVIDIPETGEQICSGCGMVVSEKLLETGNPHSLASELHSKDEMEGIKHHGSPATLLQYAPHGNLMENVNSRGSAVFIHDSQMMKMKLGIEKIQLIGMKLNLPKQVMERAAYLFRHAKNRDCGIITSRIVIAAVFVACRENHVARGLNEIVQALDLKQRNHMTANIGKLLVLWNLKVYPDSQETLIYQYGYQLRLPRQVLERALEVNKLTASLNLSRSPLVIAASCIWFAVSEGLPEIAPKDILKCEKLEQVTHVASQTISGAVTDMKGKVAFKRNYEVKPKPTNNSSVVANARLRLSMKTLISKIFPLGVVKCAHCPLEINGRGFIYDCKCGFEGACSFCIKEHLAEVKHHQSI